MYVLDTRAVSHGKVDTIEPATAAEDLLCRVDIHHREAAAERARQAPGFMMPRTVNCLRPSIVSRSILLLMPSRCSCGEVRRDDQRIGLRQEDEGIVDDAFLAAFKIVIAKAAVAGHVYGEDQQTARIREGRIHDRFDHGHGHANVRDRD